MEENQRGSVEIFDDDEPAKTLTSPELEAIAHEAGIGSEIGDSSITVIENPVYEGYLGLLLSRHTAKKEDRYLFTEVRRLRIDGKNLVMYDSFATAELEREPDGRYNQVVLSNGVVMPPPNGMPYEVCFISNSDYDNFHNGITPNNAHDVNLLMRGRLNIEDVIDPMFRLLGQNVSNFSFEDGQLSLPSNYSSLRVQLPLHTTG